MSAPGVLLAIVAACGLAGQAVFTRLATRQGRPNDVLFIVMIVNVTVAFLLVVFFVPNPTVTPTAFWAFVAAGALGSMLGRALLFAGIKRVGASRAEAIKASMPLYATIFAILLLSERVTAPQFAGVVLIVGGIALISWEGTTIDYVSSTAGLAVPVITAIVLSFHPIFASVGLQEGTPVLVGFLIMSATALVVLVLYLALADTMPSISTFLASEIHWYVLSGLASTVFFLAYYAGLSVSRVSVVVPIMQTSPLIVVGVSALFLRELELITPRLVSATGIIVSGGILVTVAG